MAVRGTITTGLNTFMYLNRNTLGSQTSVLSIKVLYTLVYCEHALTALLYTGCAAAYLKNPSNNRMIFVAKGQLDMKARVFQENT